MELLLNEQQSLLRDASAKLGALKGGPRRARKLRDADIELDADAWADIQKAGWLLTLVPEARGGLGLGAFDLALALEETGKQIVMAPLVEASAAMWALARGSSLPADADSRLVIPATELPGQSFGHARHALHLNQTASTLSGTVSFVPFAASADAFLVATSDGEGKALCVVPRDARGLTITTMRCVDGSTLSTLAFSTVALANDQIVVRGPKAADVILKMQELLLLGTSVELLGVAQAALDMTLGYIKLREQFGKPIGSFQALQHRAVNCYVDAELNRSLLYSVLAAWDAGTCHPAMVSAVKARVGKAALNTVRAALQLHGAIGYTDEHDIGIYYKRAVALAAKYGNEITHVGRFSDLTMPAQPAAE